jgi:hypothetical protein
MCHVLRTIKTGKEAFIPCPFALNIAIKKGGDL